MAAITAAKPEVIKVAAIVLAADIKPGEPDILEPISIILSIALILKCNFQYINQYQCHSFQKLGLCCIVITELLKLI